MQNRICKAISTIVMTAVLVLGILFMLIGYELYSKEARDALMSSADTALSFTDKPEEIYDVMKNAVSFDVRVTMIDNDGNVLYDSTSPAALSENHLDRPEVRQAIENGSGTAERYSNTLSRRTYYYAVKTDGGIIRFSCNTQGISAIFLGAIPIFLAAWGLVMVVAVVVSMKLSENIVTPIRKMIKSMDVFDDTIEESIADYGEYEELLPMVKLVARMKREIKDYIASLSAEKNTIGLITANMTEGMILIDRNDDIISINRSACDLVNPVFPAESGRNIIEFCRNTDFMELIEQSKCAASVTGTFSSEGRFLRAFISRISSEDKLSGAVIIIVDETEIHLAEEMRRDFSANVSHELKTPLTTIRGFAEMLGGGMITYGDDIRRYGKRIYDEANRLLNVINDIIRLSEIEENHSEIFTETNLSAVAKEVAENLAEKAKRLEIDLSVSGSDVTIQANGGYIYEMIYNLTENAVKYNRPGGKVLVDVSRAGDKAVITVADNGIGIPKEHQGRIFERFYRVDKSHSKQTGGTGLGLSIVKHIAALHHGSISVDSEDGKGTVFTVMLPMTQQTAMAPVQ